SVPHNSDKQVIIVTNLTIDNALWRISGCRICVCLPLQQFDSHPEVFTPSYIEFSHYLFKYSSFFRDIRRRRNKCPKYSFCRTHTLITFVPALMLRSASLKMTSGRAKVHADVSMAVWATLRSCRV